MDICMDTCMDNTMYFHAGSIPVKDKKHPLLDTFLPIRPPINPKRVYFKVYVTY